MDNPFDLKKNSDLTKLLISKNPKSKGKNYTENEIENMLHNCVEVPSTLWNSLSTNILIRYLRNDGAFRRGGYIKKIYNNNEKEACIRLICNPNIYPDTITNPTWIIKLKDIKTIWKEVNKNTEQNEKENQINKKLLDQEEQLKNMRNDINQLHKTVQNIIHWIKEQKI